jgi:hypothetical protein
MPNQAAAKVIGTNLGYLMYPGDLKKKPFVIPLQMFRTPPGTMPAEMAEQVDTVAQMVGCAIIHTLESAGMSIVGTTELQALRTAAAANEHQRHRQPRIKCRCGTFLFSLDITDFDTDNPTIYGPTLIEAVRHMSPECALNHRSA